MAEPIDPTIKAPTPMFEESVSNPSLVIHTYKADLALAMDTTDATVVQQLLEKSREQELNQKENQVIKHQRGWYTTAGIILLLLALAAIGYGIYYYMHLTVRVTSTPSIGVFQNTQPLAVSDTQAKEALSSLIKSSTLPVGKPYVVPVVTDEKTLTPLSTQALLTYLGSDFGEPFTAVVSLVRVGAMNTGDITVPFLLFSTNNPEQASKEFAIAEPQFLTKVGPLLGASPLDPSIEIVPSFSSTYMYNLPVRTLLATDHTTGAKTIVLYYGYASDHTIVLAANPTILKAVYETIIRQR